MARTISKFEESAYGARFRADGKLLAAGSEKGVVKVTLTALQFARRDHLLVIVYYYLSPSWCRCLKQAVAAC